MCKRPSERPFCVACMAQANAEADAQEAAALRQIERGLGTPLDRAVRRDHSLCNLSPCTDCR